MAEDVADAPRVRPVPQTARTPLPSDGPARAVGVTCRFGRRSGRAGIDVVGSRISHHVAGRRTLAGFYYSVLLCLEEGPTPHASPRRIARWMNFSSGAANFRFLTAPRS